MIEQEVVAATAPRGVRFEADGPVARIVLDRPEASNAIDLPAARALLEAVEQAADEQFRAVLLLGEGKRFCAGGDIATFTTAGSEEERSAQIAELASAAEQAGRRLTELPKPVIAAVQGAVAGAGLGIMLGADVIVAARSTTFRMAYAGIGMTPDGGVSYLLTRAVGLTRALDLAVGGRVLEAPEAQEWGLVSRLAHDEDSLRSDAVELAHQLAGGPTHALAQAKRLIRSEAARADLAADEVATIARAVRDPEAVALIAAFLSRRG